MQRFAAYQNLLPSAATELRGLCCQLEAQLSTSAAHFAGEEASAQCWQSGLPEACGKGDNRTKRGKIFRRNYREPLPPQWSHLQSYPGGPIFHQPGTHGWQQEKFRYPGEPRQGQGATAPAAGLGRSQLLRP